MRKSSFLNGISFCLYYISRSPNSNNTSNAKRYVLALHCQLLIKTRDLFWILNHSNRINYHINESDKSCGVGNVVTLKPNNESVYSKLFATQERSAGLWTEYSNRASFN